MSETLQTLVDELLALAPIAEGNVAGGVVPFDAVKSIGDRLCAALSAPVAPQAEQVMCGSCGGLLTPDCPQRDNGWPTCPCVPMPAESAAAIQLTPAEMQSGFDRVRWAEALIRQLPESHEGRNSWLLNYARKDTPSSPVPDASKAQTLITGTKEIALAETGRRADAVLNMKAAANLRERAEAEIAALSKQSDWARTCCAYEASDAALKTLVVIRDLAAALPSTGTGEDAKDAALKKARGVIRAAGSHRLLRDSEREALSGIDAALSSPAKGER